MHISGETDIIFSCMPLYLFGWLGVYLLIIDGNSLLAIVLITTLVESAILSIWWLFQGKQKRNKKI